MKNKQEEKIICDIINGDNLKNNTEGYITISIPLTFKNVISLTILFILILFGSYFLWNVLTRHKCFCKICKKEYTLDERLSEGGFGEVN